MQASLKQLISLLLGFVLGTTLPVVFYQWTEEVQVVAVSSHAELSREDSDCVCGERAEELRRMSKINLYMSKLNSNSNKNRTGPQDEAQLREFLYPRGNHTALVEGLEREPYKLLQDEYIFKKMLFVGVLTQQAYLSTRAKYLYDTWGKEVDGLMFFVGEDCIIPPSLSHLPVVKLEGVKDNVYPPLRKTFAVMKYMYDNYLHQYNWFIRADDDMYVRTRKLNDLLSKMHPYEKIYLGRAGAGRKEDLDRLHLLPHERYCMGGPGIILSMAALRNLGPHLTNCLSAVLQFSKTSYNDDDVEVGRCISRKINIQCSSSEESRHYFRFDYSGVSLNPVTLWTLPHLRSLITIHPVKHPDNMLSVHHFYKSLDLEEDYEQIHATAEYLNRLCRQLPASVSPPLSVSAGCDVKLHPYLAYFNTSSKLYPQGATLFGFLAHRNKVPFFLKPVDKFDIQPWTRFNDSLVQQVGVVTPQYSPHGSLLAELVHILSMLKPYIRTRHMPHEVTIKHLLDGYVRFNPHLGREFMLHLSLSVENSIKYERYHVIREIGPQVTVVDMPVVPSKLPINIILPLGQVDDAFLEFLKSLGHVGLQYQDNAVHLVVVVFNDDDAASVEETLRAFTRDTFPASVTISVHHGAFNALRALDIGMASLEGEDVLAFLTDVRTRFAPGFFRRCRSNAVLGQRVYFPTPFRLFQTDFSNYSDGSVPPVEAWAGEWGHYDFRMVCIFKKDYNEVGGFYDKKYSVELFEAIRGSHLDVMQAPEPGLFKVWGGAGRGCKSLSSPKRRKICLDLQRGGQFERTELSEYLGELANRKNDFLNPKDVSLI